MTTAIRRQLESMNMDELRVLARELELRGISSASKAELIDRIIGANRSRLKTLLKT